MIRKNSTPRDKRSYPTKKPHEYKETRKVIRSEAGLTGDVAGDMKKNGIDQIIVNGNDERFEDNAAKDLKQMRNSGENRYNNRRLKPGKRGRKSGRLSTRKAENNKSKHKTLMHVGQEKNYMRLIALTKKQQGVDRKHGLSKKQYNNLLKKVNSSQIQIKVIAGVKFNATAAKFFNTTVEGMKQQVISYAKNNGCEVAYSGKNRIMYLKEGYSPELEQAIIDRFGFGLPFKIMADPIMMANE